MDNHVIAARLGDYADLLQVQEADGFRVSAYRRAADVVDSLARPVTRILSREGEKGLIALPAIGRRIASAIAEMVATGRWSQLERLRGTLEPESLFMSLPGIGRNLASRICSELQVETLEALEIAAHDGRLGGVKGFGPRRLRMVQSVLADRLGSRHCPRGKKWTKRPSVATLLDVDREYRLKASLGALPRIAPRRFNPEAADWLPVLHTKRGEWDVTALYSNSARAHQLGRVGDWVVIYYQSDHSLEGQCTVVTERSGSRKGQRSVRGREHGEANSVSQAAPARGGLARVPRQSRRRAEPLRIHT